MISFLKASPRHVKTAFLSIFRHLAMSLSAASAVTITLVLLAVFLVLAGYISLFTSSIEEDLSIHAVLSTDIKEEADIQSIEKEIQSIDGVKQVRYSTPEEELELYIEEQGEEFAMFRGEENPLTGASSSGLWRYFGFRYDQYVEYCSLWWYDLYCFIGSFSIVPY